MLREKEGIEQSFVIFQAWSLLVTSALGPSATCKQCRMAVNIAGLDLQPVCVECDLLPLYWSKRRRHVHSLTLVQLAEVLW